VPVPAMAITLEKEQCVLLLEGEVNSVCESFMYVFKVFVWGNGFGANLFGRLVSNGIGKWEDKVVDIYWLFVTDLAHSQALNHKYLVSIGRFLLFLR